MAIYVNQSLHLRLKADDQNLTGYNTLEIKYRKPDDAENIWTAAIYSGDNKYIYYDIPSDILTKGDWTVWTYVTFNDGKSYPGREVTFHVNVEGKTG